MISISQAGSVKRLEKLKKVVLEFTNSRLHPGLPVIEVDLKQAALATRGIASP